LEALSGAVTALEMRLMKVICDRATLLNAANLVAGVVAQRTPKPQLTCVKVAAVKAGKTGSLVLSATDAEIALRLTLVQVDVQQPGEVLLPADKLRSITNAEDQDPTLTLESDGEDCLIKGQSAQYRVLGYPAADFPPIPGVDGPASQEAKPQIHCAAGVLSAMIARTIFATARETTRYAINGVLLKRDGKKLELVATDGRRLALARQQLPADKDAPAVQCIIPTKALSTLQKLIHSPEDHMSIAVTPNQVIFRIGPASSAGKEGPAPAILASNLVEGAFPPYEEVIPKDQDKRVTFDRETLSSAVRRAALLTNEESRGVRFKFVGAEKRLELSSRAPEMGEANVSVPISSYEGEAIEIGFNPSFITDALKVISENEVILELKAPNRQGLVKTGGGGSDFLYVVMPVNLT
jgi:DNA polymerase III subunit beta